MQKWYPPLLSDLPHQVMRDGGTISQSPMRGMRADGAELGETADMQPLPTHRHEFPILEDPVIVPEFDGPAAEWPRPREGGKRDHLTDMFLSQRDDP
jgi:hypothetical protein